jgi:hypothetical protein
MVMVRPSRSMASDSGAARRRATAVRRRSCSPAGKLRDEACRRGGIVAAGGVARECMNRMAGVWIDHKKAIIVGEPESGHRRLDCSLPVRRALTGGCAT